MVRVLFISMLVSGCSIRPLYRLEPNEYCVQHGYDTICRGYNEPPAYPEKYCSQYDEPSPRCRRYIR